MGLSVSEIFVSEIRGDFRALLKISISFPKIGMDKVVI